MHIRLIPRDIRFVDLFVESGENLAAAARKLDELIGQYDRVEERIAEIQALEKNGDRIDHLIGERLEEAFIAPFDREDIHDLTVRLDDVVDLIQAVGEGMLIYDVRQPTEDCRMLAGILAAAAVELAAALAKLERMRDLNGHLERIHELEHQADGISRAAIGRLFRDRLDPLDVIKWREVYLELENAIDACEDAAEVIERMIHKRV